MATTDVRKKTGQETIRSIDPATRKPIELSQLEMLGSDVDIDDLKLVMNRKVIGNIGESIIGGSVRRTIEGASTLILDIQDHDRLLLNSGKLVNKLDMQINGLWWRYVALDKSGDVLTLTFEEREIAVMRTYATVIPPVSRSDMTRFEFILKMIKDIKEFRLDYYIPDLHKALPIQEDTTTTVNITGMENIAQIDKQRGKGLTTGLDLTVKGEVATLEQIQNIDIILRTGDKQIPDKHIRKRKLLVCSVMTVIVESTAHNYPGGDKDSHGLFQQRPSAGWNSSDDAAIQAAEFFDHILNADAANPNMAYNDLCQKVQGSAHPTEYGKRRVEAEAWVSAFGIPGGDSVGTARDHNNQLPADLGVGDYHYYRGVLPTNGQSKMLKEDMWKCIQRLVQEVGYRAFVISGTLYIFSEDELMKSKPRAVLTVDTDGIIDINGNYDQGKKVASVDVDLFMGRFDIPPGSVVVLKNMGPMNGRYVVATVSRDLFDPKGTLNLKKPDPVLPEPAQDNISATSGFATTPGSETDPTTGGSTITITPDTNDIKVLAERILKHYDNNNYRDDNGSQIAQWRKLADGKKLHNQCGNDVDMNPRVPQALLMFLDNGWMIGTFALVEDHHCNQGQHPLGGAVDISSLGKKDIGWRNINKYDRITTSWIKEAVVKMRDINPNQVISNGNEFVDPEIQRLQWSGGQIVSYITDDHVDHIHLGV